MRLVAGLVALLLSASLVHAEESKAPEPQAEPARARVPLRVVSVLPESHQALLFDHNRGTHVLASEGGTIAGYTVIEIGEDEVVLTADGTQVVLAAPARTWRRGSPAAEIQTAAPRPATPTPIDPYAGPGPLDPYLDPYTDPVRVADAPRPISAGEGGVRVAEAPGTAPAAPAVMFEPAGGPVTTPSGPVTTPSISDEFASALTGAPSPAAPAAKPVAVAEDPYASEPSDEAAAHEAAGTAAAPAPGPAPVAPTVLSRRELTAALADFSRLTGVLRGAFTATGARLDVVAPGSVFAQAGLQPGDIVTAVDGKPLRTIDDAADLYVRASSTRAANIQIARAGTPLTLRVLLQ